VVFDEINQFEMPNFLDGTFKLKVNGSVTVAIQGEVTQIDGKDSEIQIMVDNQNKPRFQLINGKATLNTGGRKTDLSQHNLAEVGPAKPLQPLLPNLICQKKNCIISGK